MFDSNQIKKDFPILARQVHGKPLVYLDNAATTQKPQVVIDAISRYYENHNANTHRGIHVLGEEATEIQEGGREIVARFLNAEPEEIVFVRNATEALNLVAYTWALENLREGDVVVATRMEHHANFVTWQMVCEMTGAKLEIWELEDDGELHNIDKSPLNKGGVKLLALTQASNVLGTINSIKEIVDFAKHAGIVVVVDAAQSAPNMKIDVKDLNCHFLALSGHKMMGPMGIGVLYGRKELLKDMSPFLRGGSMIDVVEDFSSTWNNLPYKFEAGTPDVASVAGLTAAIGYLEQLGMDNILKHEQELGAYTIERLLKFKQIKILGLKNPQKRVGLVSFTVEGVHPHDIATIFDSEGVAIRSGHHCAQPLHRKLGLMASARISPYVYNSKEDIDRAMVALKEVIEIFK